MRHATSSDFKNLSINWEKHIFHWENGILNPLEILHISGIIGPKKSPEFWSLGPLYIELLYKKPFLRWH